MSISASPLDHATPARGQATWCRWLSCARDRAVERVTVAATRFGGVGMTAARSAPLVRVTWTDPVTGKNGYLVVHTLVSGIATGGTRMRAGCTESEVADLAYGMALKTATFNLPVGGAKGGIDCDPKDPQARGVLERFVTAMRPWL